MSSQLSPQLHAFSPFQSSLSALISRKTSRKVPTSTRIVLQTRPTPPTPSASCSSSGQPYPFSLSANSGGILKSPHSNNELRGVVPSGSRSGSFVGSDRAEKKGMGGQQQPNSFDSSTLAGITGVLRRDSACSSPGTTTQQQPPLPVGAGGTRNSSPSAGQRTKTTTTG
jgi:hypothetical protein